MKTRKPVGQQHRGDRLKIWSRLQTRMTFTYVDVSIVTALLAAQFKQQLLESIASQQTLVEQHAR